MNAEHVATAAAIDARVTELFRNGLARPEILGEMTDYMPAFRPLMDLPQSELDELCMRFPAFYYYAKLIEGIALGISTVEIKVS